MQVWAGRPAPPLAHAHAPGRQHRGLRGLRDRLGALAGGAQWGGDAVGEAPHGAGTGLRVLSRRCRGAAPRAFVTRFAHTTEPGAVWSQGERCSSPAAITAPSPSTSPRRSAAVMVLGVVGVDGGLASRASGGVRPTGSTRSGDGASACDSGDGILSDRRGRGCTGGTTCSSASRAAAAPSGSVSIDCRCRRMDRRRVTTRSKPRPSRPASGCQRGMVCNSNDTYSCDAGPGHETTPRKAAR